MVHAPTIEIFFIVSSHYMKIKILCKSLELAWNPLEDKGQYIIILVAGILQTFNKYLEDCIKV